MKCKNCANYECSDRGDGERECTYINGPYRFFGTPTMPFFDWQSFRAEAAKDILCAMINRESSFTKNEIGRAHV